MTIDWNKYGIDVSKVLGKTGNTLCPRCSSLRKPQHQKLPVMLVDMTTGKFTCQHCDYAGWVKSEERPMREKRIYTKPEPRPKAVGVNLLAWFKSRGISNETLLTAKVTEAVEWMPQTNKEMNCACFNYYREGELVNIKFRDGNKGFKLSKDAELIFYNIDSIRGRSEAIITEGEIDCLSLVEIGATNVVSVPNGATTGNQKLVYLDNCIDDFDGVEKIILATDDDEAGLSLRNELVRRLGSDRCYLVKYPVGCKDSNEVLVKHGKETLLACISMARQCDLEGIITIDSLKDRIDNIAKHGYPSVLKLEYIGLNELIKWRGGELTVVTGVPSHGKSEFLDQLAIMLSTQHKWRFAIFSPENQPTEIHAIKLLEKLFGANLKDIPDSEMMKCLDYLNDYFYFISVDDNDTTVDGILSKCAELVKRYGINSVIIDPWNVISHVRDKGQDKNEYISECLTKMTSFAMKYNTHVFLVAHPTKMQKDLVTKKVNVPTLYDISDSAHFYNKAFNGICVYRNFDTDTVSVHVQKVKFKWVGKTGVQEFTYDVASGRYAEVGDRPMNQMRYVNGEQDDIYNSTTKKIMARKIEPPVFHNEPKDKEDLDDQGNSYPF